MEEVAAADSLRFPLPENQSCLKFMELIAVDQEFSSQFDVFSLSSLSSSLFTNPVENLEIGNQWPTTPNYSSSSEIVNDEVIEPKLEREEKQHSRQTLKTTFPTVSALFSIFVIFFKRIFISPSN